METPIPDALLQDLCNAVKSRFAAETGCTGPTKVDLAFPEPPSSRFTVIATVTDKTSGEQRRYEIEIRAATVH